MNIVNIKKNCNFYGRFPKLRIVFGIAHKKLLSLMYYISIITPIMKKVGFTSTIPVEAVFAAGLTPVDLNNIFVMQSDPISLVTRAKMDGFPDTTCSWICGLYGTALSSDIDTIIGVTGGDCSETLALMEILSLQNKKIIPFTYPHAPNPKTIYEEISSLAAALGTTYNETTIWKERLDPIRQKVMHLDTLLWKENLLSGDEARLAALSCTDFEGDPVLFEKKIDAMIHSANTRTPFKDELRIGICGVPPIVSNLYQHLERNGVRVVFSEVERQFSIFNFGTIDEAYSLYTYPYGIFPRIHDIQEQIKLREIDGIIHYVQSFCFRSIEDIALRKKIDVPVLTLQGDLPSRVTETMEIRLEAFTDMLRRRKRTIQRN